MGIYYTPPPPAGRSAVTPPEPHVPIATPGSQPPRYSTAVMLVAVLASWPQDLEPRLSRPNEQQQKIAPLTLTYGQQPPRFSVASRMAVVAAWPPDLEPRLTRPNDQPQKIAPLTLTYGAQPTPVAPLAPGAWPSLVTAWTPTWDAPRPVAIAPLTLPYGAQPPRQAPLAIATLTPIVASWAQTWDAQTAPRSTAWNAPLVPVIARTPPPASLWTAWEPPWLSPPRPVAIAPLTLPYGAQPIPQAPLSTLELAQIVGTWASSWDAQTAPKSAAWNVPIASGVPSVALPAHLWTAWIDPVGLPPKPVAIAPLTLAYGAPPLPQGPLSPLELTQIVGSWSSTWDAQTAGKSAAWNVPPPISTFVPFTPAPALIWTAWTDASLPTQTAPPNAGWNVPPPSAFVPYTPLPSLIWWAWTDTGTGMPLAPLGIAAITAIAPVVPPIVPTGGGGGGLLYQRHWPPIAYPGKAYPQGVSCRSAVGQAIAIGTHAPPHAIASPLGVQARMSVGRAIGSVSVIAIARGAPPAPTFREEDLALILLLLLQEDRMEETDE